MQIIEIIEKKKSHMELSYEELKFMVDGYLSEEVKDYQMSAFLMSICINGMTEEETINLTDIFINSGDIIDLSSINGIVVDKHSTGGVGDKTTLIVAPLVATCGINVAKMSGRGLGHTGGTADKLEAIPGFNINLTNKEFIKEVNEIGLSLVTQTGNLVPADKKIYALRDVTATTSSLPLIASSIMSKKIASGASKIVIDLKIGNGALVKNFNGARYLSRLMIAIGKKYKKEVVCVLSNMNVPLGTSIGNSLEVLEAIDVLNNVGPGDTKKLSLVLASYMVSLGKNIGYEEAYKLVNDNLLNGNAYKKFLEMVKYQKGDINKIELSKNVKTLNSVKEGYIVGIDALKLGLLAKNLGAGRNSKEDIIDYSVGFKLLKQVGEHINLDEPLINVYYNDLLIDYDEVIKAFIISDTKKELDPLIYDVIK